MSAALIAVIAVLLAGHVAQSLTTLRRFDWLVEWRRYVNGASEPVGALSGRGGLVLVIGLPVLLTGLLQIALRHSLWGIPGFLFGLLLLFYCWGPRDLDLDVDAIVEAPDSEHKREAAASLSPNPSAATSDDVALDGHALVEGVFNGALRRWFGPLFWFLLLGPSGALLYRITALLGADAAHADAPVVQREDARWLLSVLDWPVAHLMTFALALAANFDAVFGAWREWARGGHPPGDRIPRRSSTRECGYRNRCGRNRFAGGGCAVCFTRIAGIARRDESGVADVVVVVGGDGGVCHRALALMSC